MTTSPSSSHDATSASSSPFLYSTSPASGGGQHSSSLEINNNSTSAMNENYETLINRSQMNANGIYEHMGVEDEKRPDFYDDMFS